MDIENNHMARCTTGPIVNTIPGGWACQGHTGDMDNGGDGRDAHGYWARVGYYGLVDTTNNFCDASSTTWAGNVYDDTGATVPCAPS
jgi:hypothetical protein